MSSFRKSDVLAACAQFGPMLNVPSNLDGIKVMAAIASNESSFGANCGPRHEPAYDVGGSLSSGTLQQNLLSEYGSDAACSYGPWQMMFDNFTGYSPAQLLTDLQGCAVEFVRFFNSYIIGSKNAQSLSDIGQIWNSGHISTTPSIGVATYCSNLQKAYDLL